MFINSLLDNDAIIQSLDRNKSQFGQEIYQELKYVSDGKGISLGNLKKILDKYKTGSVGVLYLKLFS